MFEGTVFSANVRNAVAFSFANVIWRQLATSALGEKTLERTGERNRELAVFFSRPHKHFSQFPAHPSGRKLMVPPVVGRNHDETTISAADG
jgi:hypothetical protein